MPPGDVRYLKGVGPVKAARLSRLGITTTEDLLLHIPRSYLDRRLITPIADLVPGREYTISCNVTSVSDRPSRKGRRVLRANVSDSTGSIPLTFFNARFVRNRLVQGARIMVSGSLGPFPGSGMIHPDLVFLDSLPGDVEPVGVLPVYPLSEGLNQGTFRRLITGVLDDPSTVIPDIIPPRILADMGWESRAAVLRSVHRPSSPEEGERARRALALEELYIYSSVLREIRRMSDEQKGIPLLPGENILARFRNSLPFTPTPSQERVIGEIASDLGQDRPMRRLLQGDVGCGKTVVAAAACSICSASGTSTVVVAPTEVLADQHHRTMKTLLTPLGHSCEVLTGGTPAGERRRILTALTSGEVDILIGTHAVFEESVSIPDLALCVVDEQHKFGVEQRESLMSSLSPRPHMLIMSATPIPRTLAMTLYGDLDVSIIDEMPPGRGRVRTTVRDRDGRAEVFRFLEERLQHGERAFIVYPLREVSSETDVRDATSSHRILSGSELGRFGVGLLTGAMSATEKLETTGKFLSGEISLLVSTTVIEVGIDVPEATVMIVANAERFGLSQLHQLRGRIGRSGRDSWCFLMKGENCGAEATRRLAVLESTSDGFEIARRDLQLRGPGEVAGTRQHGLPVFRIASLEGDLDLVERAAVLAAGFAPGKEVLAEFSRRFGRAAPPGV